MQMYVWEYFAVNVGLWESTIGYFQVAYLEKNICICKYFFLHRLDSLWGRRRLSAGWWYGEEMTDRRTSVS